VSGSPASGISALDQKRTNHLASKFTFVRCYPNSGQPALHRAGALTWTAQRQRLASLPSGNSPFATLLSLGGLSLLPGARCSVVVSDNPLMLLPKLVRASLPLARPVRTRMGADHAGHARGNRRRGLETGGKRPRRAMGNMGKETQDGREKGLRSAPVLLAVFSALGVGFRGMLVMVNRLHLSDRSNDRHR
jgi:hypothetical protein